MGRRLAALPDAAAAINAELAAMLAHISDGAGRSLLSAESAHSDLLHVHAHLLALVSQAPAASEASLACVCKAHKGAGRPAKIGCMSGPFGMLADFDAIRTFDSDCTVHRCTAQQEEEEPGPGRPQASAPQAPGRGFGRILLLQQRAWLRDARGR